MTPAIRTAAATRVLPPWTMPSVPGTQQNDNPAPVTPSARYRQLGVELDLLKAKVFAQVGDEDVLRVKSLNRFSLSMEVVGRVLLHVSFEPVTFTLGVIALFIHKQLQATEIGHTALHGAYDKLPGAEAFASKGFRWDTPIDEESWKKGHNLKHHGNTNVAGKDPDIHFGPVRLTERTPHKFAHYLQLPLTLGLLFPFFGFLMNLHFTGLLDAYGDNGQPEGLDVLPDRSFKSRLGAWGRALRKYVPYYVYNFVLFPLLAGPGFLKVAAGNAIVEVMRDVYSAATIFCGHVGEDVADYEHGHKAGSRGEWYAMQIESANDFEVSRPLSILCGGLDRQIEHHLFPTLPPERLRQIAPEVREICERHGVSYKTASWPATLKKALSQIARLARPVAPRSKIDGLREVLRSMS